MIRPTVAVGMALILVAVVVAGCSSVGGFTTSPPVAAPTPAASAAASATAGSNPTSESTGSPLASATTTPSPGLSAVGAIPPGPLPAGRYAEFYLAPHFSLWVPAGSLLIYDEPDAFGLVKDLNAVGSTSVFVLLAPDESVIAKARADPLVHVSPVLTESIDGHPGQAVDLTYLGTDPHGFDLVTRRDHPNSHAMLVAGSTTHLVEFEANGVRLLFMAGSSTVDYATFQPVISQIEQSIEFLAN